MTSTNHLKHRLYVGKEGKDQTQTLKLNNRYCSYRAVHCFVMEREKNKRREKDEKKEILEVVP